MGTKHNQQSSNVMGHLAGWGFSQNVQQRIGALAVVWGVFETNLETTLWELNGEKVKGVRPSTDRSSISEWIEDLGKKGAGNMSIRANEVLQGAAIAAKDLMNYRHAIMHGCLIPSATMPIFIRNPAWNGEQRKRPSNDAHVDENLLDMAIDCVWILCRVVFEAKAACIDTEAMAKLEELKPDIARAKSLANELRHLTALMNHEKY